VGAKANLEAGNRDQRPPPPASSGGTAGNNEGFHNEQTLQRTRQFKYSKYNDQLPGKKLSSAGRRQHSTSGTGKKKIKSSSSREKREKDIYDDREGQSGMRETQRRD